MKERKMSKITAVITVLVMILAAAPVGSGFPFYAAGKVYAKGFEIPEADYTLRADDNWSGTLYINQNETLKLVDITHDNTGTSAGSAIRIASGHTVTLVFEGDNILSGNGSIDDLSGGAGIEVEKGATVNIYGTEDSSLTVTGGNLSAGIGGIGYESPGTENLSTGNINIYSGNITAIGGERGAGIGSGYHQSAGDIQIYDGDITALGTLCGAGIGAGYGTAGGAALDSSGNHTGAGIGYYHGGNITISGGTVRAAGYHMNFDSFDPCDPETLYGEGYSNTFAAGIGGGYGASSGNILIEGDADVTAIGSCGGAGIGTGRGAAKMTNYDADYARCHVTIGGNAKVIAMTTADRRTTITGDDGGAGIGLGRGWNRNGTPDGDVTIGGNANVYAYAEESANGIGASTVVGKYESIGGTIIYPPASHLKSLSIGPDCTVTAISDGQDNPRKAFDEILDLGAAPAAELHFTDQFFEDNKDFLTADKFPLKVDVCSASDSKVLATFSLSEPADQRVGLHLPASAAKGAYLRIKDYQQDGVGVLIAHADSQEIWKYEKGDYTPADLIPEEHKITYNLNGGTNAAANPASYKVYGPAVRLSDPTRSGYAFEGWYGNADLTGPKVTSVPAGSMTDQEFWAKWTKKPDPVPAALADKTLVVKAVAKGRSLVFTWNAVPGAGGYDIYFAKCANNAKFKKVKTVKGSVRKWTKTGLKKKKAYKVYVKAWVRKKGKKTCISKSPDAHIFTSGGNKSCSNAKSLTVAKTKVSIAKGKTAAVKARIKLVNSKKKLMGKGHAPRFRYLSSDRKVATVSKKGRIKGVAPGSCYVYVYTHNGISKKILVTVK